MYRVMVVATVFFMAIGALWYVWLAWKRETDPVPATWILMFSFFVLSMWMYWQSPNKSWEKNVGLTAGLANVAIILIGVIMTNIKYGTLKIAFDRTQFGCLIAGAVIFVFWLVTDNPFVAYILVQFIALVAYGATVKRLRNSNKTTEPIITWVAVLLASLTAIYPAWVSYDLFAQIYLIRAVPSTAFMIVLISRIKKRMRLGGG